MKQIWQMDTNDSGREDKHTVIGWHKKVSLHLQYGKDNSQY